MIVNGASQSDSFAAMICATRNETLDELAKGSPKEILETKLRFGVLRNGREKIGEERLAFGVEGEIEGVKRKLRDKE
jgi:hypothetical protein